MGNTRHSFNKIFTQMLILCGLGALPQFAYPQDYLFNAQMLTAEDGLANLMTTAIYKDKQGFIWIGTAYGLDRYDGHNFKLFTREENALTNNADISQIREDEHGRLWLFFRDGRHAVPQPNEITGLDIFDPNTEQAIPFDTLFSGNTPFKAKDICLPRILDPKNRLWIHTNTGALFLYDQGRFKKIFQQEGTFFRFISIDDNENIWLGWKNNLAVIDRAGKILEKVVLPDQVIGIWTASGGDIWVATQEIRDQPITLWHKPKNNPLIPFELTHNGQPVHADPTGPFLYLDQDGYWLAKIDRQLQLFDHQGKWLFNYNTLLEKSSNVGFFSYFKDSDWLWVASASGVLKVSIKTNPFKLIHRKKSLLSDCRGITEDAQGNIYFLNSNIYKWDVLAQTCRELPNSSGATYSLLYTDSTIWAGTYGESPMGFQLDLRTGKRTNYLPFDLTKFLAYSIAKTGNPQKFLVGLNRGLAYLDLKQQKLLPFDDDNPLDEQGHLLDQCEINYIHKNTSGYWLATNNGIFLLKEKEGIVRHYDRSAGDLPFDNIRHIYEDEDGAFWLATKGGGVIRWQPQEEQKTGMPSLGARGSRYRQFTVEDGLADNYTYAVIGDDYGKLWIPSDKGLMQMDKRSFRIRTLTTEDGLPHNEFNYTAHFQSKDGTLYLGGLGGLVAFHPKVFADEGVNSTPLAYTGFYVLEEHADKMADKTRLLRESGAVTIYPRDKFFELHFMLLDFDKVEHHRYAYQVQGYSNNVNYTDENFIRITHLPYGNYTLRIQGQNSRKGWSEQELSIEIYVLKPFYLQGWFIATLVMLVAGAITGAVRWRIKGLQKGKEQLESEVQKRTLTIRQQAEELKALDKAKTRFFSNITHEFRTPLTLIIGPLEQVAAENTLPIMFKRRINGVLKNARHLLTLINQLLDLSKIEGGQMKAEVMRGDIAAYTKELVSRFQPLSHKKELTLVFLPQIDCWETFFDKEKWDKILYNLLSNAIKFSSPGQHIQVSLMKTQRARQDFIRLDVKDSGMGIANDHLPLIFDRFYQADSTSTRTKGGTGIGLALVKELVELQGGEIRVSSEVNKGTSFEVLLPVLEPAEARILEAAEPSPAIVEPADGLPVLKAGPEGHPKLELLLIEDNEEMREYIRYCIDPALYNITEAADGEEGIQKAQALVPDLIISDVMMPKKNGFEVVKFIRSHIGTSHIPLILLTARASLESRLEGLQRGADAYLTKPFSPQELALRIQKLIEIRRLLQQRYQSGAKTPDHAGPFQPEDEFIAGIRAFILEHIDESGLDGDHIGRHFGMSRVSLYRKINALTGQSISELVRSVRLDKALEMIRERKLNISEIAYQTGFSSISAFSRTFKQAYGKAPSEI